MKTKKCVCILNNMFGMQTLAAYDSMTQWISEGNLITARVYINNITIIFKVGYFMYII